jgi:hypothetical protein
MNACFLMTGVLLTLFRYTEKGLINSKFLRLKNVERATAENITKELESAVQEYGELKGDAVYEKMVGFGADGASVNMGSKHGIGARLTEKQPLLTSVHCMAHHLELSFNDVIGLNNSRFEITRSRFENVITIVRSTAACYVCLQKRMELQVYLQESVERVGYLIFICL